MADSQDGLLVDTREILEKNENFEQKVKRRLNWSFQKWMDMEENDSKLKKLTNSMRYWCVKLAKAQGENNVIIGLYNEHRNVSLALFDVINQLNLLGVGDNLIGFNYFRNPRYINFTFDSKEVKMLVLKNLKQIGDSDVVFLEWASNTAEAIVKTHWVPADVEVDTITAVLTHYGIVKSATREVHKLMNGKNILNGTITFEVELKKNVELKDLPYFCNVKGLELLVNVTGRPILCLNCGLQGHKSSECNTPYCSKCKKIQEKIHNCIVRVGNEKWNSQESSGFDHEAAAGKNLKEALGFVRKENIKTLEGMRDMEFGPRDGCSQSKLGGDNNGQEDTSRSNKENLIEGSSDLSDDDSSEDLCERIDQNVPNKLDQFAEGLENLRKESSICLGNIVAMDITQKQESTQNVTQSKMDIDNYQLKRNFIIMYSQKVMT